MSHTAGKITIATACSGLLVFAAVFLLDVGRDHIQVVSAQGSGTATTSLTVRNLPPVWDVEAFEQTPSATNTPINTGEQVVWEAEATNNLPYWLLICSTNSATATPATGPGLEGDEQFAPECGAGATQWALSTSTQSGEVAIAATTTIDGAPFGESNEWYAFVCDADQFDPRCAEAVQGEEKATAENDDAFSSPFVLNFRPILNDADNDGPTLPGDVIEFTSDSSDPNTLRGDDEIFLHVCATNSFSNGSCDPGQTFASSSVAFTENAEASFLINIPTVAFTYEAYVFLVDQFDHQAANSIQSDFDVANATPEVDAGTISLNNGDSITLTEALATTSGFTLDFEVSSNNSCVAVDGSGTSLGAGSEFADIVASVYRESVGTTTCDGTAGPFDANNCYTSGAAAQWDFSCTKDTSSCTDNGATTTDMTSAYNCTFSLWHVADPTDGTTASEVEFPGEEWFAAASVIDAAGATSSFTTNPSGGVDVESFLAFDLGTNAIPYGTLEPEEDTGNLIATTTILATGNTGVDQDLEGSSMCPDFDVANAYDSGNNYGCSGDASDTIPANFQEFGLDNTIAYGSGEALIPGSQVTALVNVAKPTVIQTATDDDIYWGIAVPEDITLAGNYTGQNAFFAILSDAQNW